MFVPASTLHRRSEQRYLQRFLVDLYGQLAGRSKDDDQRIGSVGVAPADPRRFALAFVVADERRNDRHKERRRFAAS